MLQRHEIGRRLFGYLVGSAFSLWRAATLSDTTRSWDAILDDAQKLLHRLIHDNAVAYPQDRDTKEWMGGYYLNNARFRLLRARVLLGELYPTFSSPALTRLEELDRSGTTGRRPSDCWEIFHESMVDMLGMLEKRLAHKP